MLIIHIQMKFISTNKLRILNSNSWLNLFYFTAQKISPDSKEKVQLQLVMHDGSANTFHFNNPKGRENAIHDRDGIKELLQQLLPKFRNKISSELEMKNK